MDDHVAKLLADFEAECAEAGVKPGHALMAGGLHRGQWRRWQVGPFMPTLRSLQMAREGLARLSQREAA